MRMDSLSTALWQLTEIAKALAKDAQVLILDEPTASLAKHEADTLFELVERLKDRGMSIIYISHRMDEIYRIADRITILRDGRRVLTEQLAKLTPEQVVDAIVGRRMEATLTWQERSVAPDAEVVLEAQQLTAGSRVRDVSFQLRSGEILGLAGLMGSGRTELTRCLFGIDRLDSGQVFVRGKPVDVSKPDRAMAAGIALIPEDRRDQGLILDHSVRDNLLLPVLSQLARGPVVNDRHGKALAQSLMDRFSIKVAHPSRPVRLLSGGNQQKVVIAKWLSSDPDILILDEPTAGVDIGTKTEILDMIRGLADTGKGIVLISSELPELLAVSDRVLVLRDGAVHRDLPRRDIADEESLQLTVQGV
jgi:ribose transport system ATP-binding protein